MPPSPRAAFDAALAPRYTIERELGRGGMATVLLACDLRHSRPVAIKVLHRELASALGPERFAGEIQVTAALQHPNLLPLFDSGEAAGELYYVMPYLEGETLRARLDRERQLPVHEAVRIATAIAEGLSYAHAHGVVHRDVKPENVLFQAGQPVLADFGIALAARAGGDERLTMTGISLGTPQYMSPEQATGDRLLDARSDQYALAAMTYEMLTGEPPHVGPTPQVLVARILTEAPRPAHQVRGAIPVALGAALDRALAKSPADRFPDLRAFATELQRAIGMNVGGANAGAPSGMRTAPLAADAPAPRRSFMLPVVGGIAAAAAAIGAFWLTRPATDTIAAAPADPAAILVVPTVAEAGLASLALQVDDAVASGLGLLSGVRVRTATDAATTDADAARLARAAGAATATLTSLVALGEDSVQLRMRLVGAADGNVIRQLPGAAIPRAGRAAVPAAVEPLVVATGYVATPTMGSIALPAQRLPRLEAFLAMRDALVDFPIVNSPGRAAAVEDNLRRAIASDTAYLQARLWLGVLAGTSPRLSRQQDAPARADSVRGWAEAAQRGGTPYERALARVAVTGFSELGDASVEAMRAFVQLAPGSALARRLPLVLRSINRPREALRYLYAELEHGLGGDTSAVGRATHWRLISETWHYLGAYDSALVTIRRAREARPSDQALLGGELSAWAALGQLDSVRALLPEVEAAAGNNEAFGFAGNSYNVLGQELIAHGHEAEGRAVLQRAADWFARNAAYAEGNTTAMVRWVHTLIELGRLDEARERSERLMARVPAEARAIGLVGRVAAREGRQDDVARILRVLEALPAEDLQGASTYERAAITANLGASRWEEAVQLFELSIRQGMGFDIRARAHFFTDWRGLRDFAPLQQALRPRG